MSDERYTPLQKLAATTLGLAFMAGASIMIGIFTRNFPPSKKPRPGEPDGAFEKDSSGRSRE